MNNSVEERKDLAQNRDIFRFKCTKCGKCCSDPLTFINVTYIDILNLMKGLNLDMNGIMKHIGFYTFEGEDPKNYMDQMVFSSILTEKGHAYIGLIKDEKSRCTFLDELNICKIYNSRPKICRTFPFTYYLTESKGLKAELDLKFTTKGIQYCPGISKTGPLIKKKKILTIITEFLGEISADFKIIESWNNLVEKKKISPIASQYIKSIVKMEQEINSVPKPKKKTNRGRKFQRL